VLPASPDAPLAAALPPGAVLAIDHVGIAVTDLDAAVAMYETAFGMTCVHVEVNEEQGVREAMLEVGSSGSFLQLLAPLSPDSPIGRFLERSGPGIQQMAYRVRSVDEVSAHLRAHGHAAAVRPGQARDGREPGQLRAPEERGRRAGRAGGARARGARRALSRT
jgi:methylmalonyl-CoA/ethylmalonyl-CoA epimerase